MKIGESVLFYTALPTFTKPKMMLMKNLKKKHVYKYLCRKVEGYKEQDREAKRKLDYKTYIAADWLLDRLNGCCEKCSVDVYVETMTEK